MMFAEALLKIEEVSEYTTPVKYPRNELNIFWEYAMRDLGRARIGSRIDKKIRNLLGTTEDEDYIGRGVFRSLFNAGLTEKQMGWNTLVFIILPSVLI